MTVGNWGTVHIREITPKDFYLAQILRAKGASLMPLVKRLVLNIEVVNELPGPVFKKFMNWVIENILEGNILTVDNWLEVSFHLCKQRWDQSMDWLETQPMSKIRAMIDILERHVEAEKDAMKRA